MPKPKATQDTLTLMVFAAPAGRSLRIDLRRRGIRSAAVALGLGAVALLALSVDYVRARSQIADLSRLRAEHDDQRRQIESYLQQMEAISGKLTELDLLERKLRALADIVDPSDSPATSGVGGTTEPSTGKPGNSDSGARPGVGGAGVGGFGAALPEPVSLRVHGLAGEAFAGLPEAVETRAESLRRLLARLEEISSRLRTTPSITPTEGWVSSAFGRRLSPFSGQREFHRGIDIAGRKGTPVLASADGVVGFKGVDGALGKTVHLRHGYGVVTKYGHLDAFSVERGQRVMRGQRIGSMGNTGRSSGPHLHYQVEVERRPVDPRGYILD